MPANGTSPDMPGTALAAATPRDDRSAKFVGYGLFGLILILVVSLFLLTGASFTPGTKLEPGRSDLFLFSTRLTPDQVILLAVLVSGALGGCVHVATSFSDYVGNAQYRANWQWWYLLRPFIGGCLATAFYFLMRGGVMSMAATSVDNALPNMYGMIAVSFLVGMFSKQATDKLDDVFDTLFKSDKDNARTNGLESTVPVLTTLVPAAADAGSGDTRVVLAGSNFAAGAQVRVNGKDRAADSVQPNAVEVTLKAEDLAAPARLKIAVLNASGALSGEKDFEVSDRRQVPGSPDDRGGTGAGTQEAAGQPAAGQDTPTQTPAGQPAAGQTPDASSETTDGEAEDERDLVSVTNPSGAGEQTAAGQTDDNAVG